MMKRVFNYSEEKVFEELNLISDQHKFKVYPKVRVADVLTIENSGISNEYYRYALQAHFDFVIADKNQMPLFVVEFDGPQHLTSKQCKRDQIKNELCKQCKCPILRINSNYISKKYRDQTLLSWVINTYQAQIHIFEVQESGHLPQNELFFPSDIAWCSSTPTKNFPYQLSLNARVKLSNLYKKDKVKLFSNTIGHDQKGNLCGIIYIEITNNKWLYVTSAMRSQDFPIDFTDLFDDLLIVFLYEKVELYFKNQISASSTEETMNKLAKYCKRIYGWHPNAKVEGRRVSLWKTQ